MTPTLEEKFWMRVQKRGDDECWLWTGCKTHSGYGRLVNNGETVLASRLAWSISHGKPFPEGKIACHTCDTPLCVNPSHIWAGTHSENLKDAVSKGRINFSAMHSRNHNREKTHCRNGHEYSGSNLRIVKFGRDAGKRRCRACELASLHRSRSRRKEERERSANEA